ncbi:hypothetical protein NQ317_017060 [Molorchus minor]|uniref:Uncharacterized protein n=1 Tax=Molorchus minor TaxID=1323400 RepID=A0ABQ9K4A0_9CUCU|nr:hypothetical protein NQ317_017060 [Molorchus minor]
MKRELVEFGVLNVEKELFFSKIVLSSKSKSNEAFSYRRWLIKRMCRKNTDNTIPLLTLLQNELMVTHMASEKSSNNYHSWNHRIWCIENMASSSNIVYSELSYSQEWINSHVSEHSGYHYRQYLITLVKDHKNIDSLFDSYYNFALKHFNLFDQGEYSHSQLLIYLMGNQKKKKTYSYINYSSLLLHDLFVLIDKLDSFYPEHESLFYHRRFVVYHLVKFVYEYQGAEFPIRNEVTGCHGNPINNNTVKNDISMSKKKSNGNIKCHRPKLFHPDQNKKEIGNLYRIIFRIGKAVFYLKIYVLHLVLCKTIYLEDIKDG